MSVIEFLVLIPKWLVSLLVTSTQQQAEDASAICFAVVEDFTICSSLLVGISKVIDKYIESVQESPDHKSGVCLAWLQLPFLFMLSG